MTEVERCAGCGGVADVAMLVTAQPITENGRVALAQAAEQTGVDPTRQPIRNAACLSCLARAVASAGMMGQGGTT